MLFMLSFDLGENITAVNRRHSGQEANQLIAVCSLGGVLIAIMPVRQRHW